VIATHIYAVAGMTMTVMLEISATQTQILAKLNVWRTRSVWGLTRSAMKIIPTASTVELETATVLLAAAQDVMTVI